MKKIKFFLFLKLFFILFPFSVNSETFDEWKLNFSKYASSQGVSDNTLSLVIDNLKFLPIDGTFKDNLGNFGQTNSLVYMLTKKIILLKN